ncbi:MAG: tagatose-6-phosphate ketose isomerase [Acidobacteriaceae bacterium]
MNPLADLLSLSASAKHDRGLVHTPVEIAQQPETWPGTFEILTRRRSEIQQFLTRCGVGGSAAERPIVFLIGAGTSDYIGHSLFSLLQSEWQCTCLPVASTSLLPAMSDYVLPDRRYLWISFSRSGDSPEGVAALERALADYPNVAHLLITCNPSGAMMRAVAGRPGCLAIVLDEKTNDHGLAMTSSFTNMVVAGQSIAHAWSLDRYQPILDSLVAAASQFLPAAAAQAAELAQSGLTRACFVGTGLLAGAAMESALKLLELTAGRVQTMSQATLALRHGPMAALNHQTIFVSFVSSQAARRRYELDLLREIGSKRLVRSRIAVAVAHPAEVAAEAECVLAPAPPRDIPDAYRPVLDVIFGQLLGLFASIQCGLKPDVPSPNGAISRVVQNVGIY